MTFRIGVALESLQYLDNQSPLWHMISEKLYSTYWTFDLIISLKSNYYKINIDGINVSEKGKHWRLLNYVISPIIDTWSLQTSFLLYKYRGNFHTEMRLKGAGKAILSFGPDRIRTLVFMAADSSQFRGKCCEHSRVFIFMGSSTFLLFLLVK